MTLQERIELLREDEWDLQDEDTDPDEGAGEVEDHE